PGRTAAVDGDDDVELVAGLSQRERLLDDHLEHFVPEVFVERALVYDNLAAALTKMHTRRRCLAPAGAVVFNESQQFPPRLFRDVDPLGLLRLMRVIRATVNLQLLEHLAAELALRQHSPHRFLDHGLWLLRAH